MTRLPDPSAMSARDQLAEVARILAAGYIRLTIASRRCSQNSFADSAEGEAPWDQVVNRERTPPGKESA